MFKCNAHLLRRLFLLMTIIWIPSVSAKHAPVVLISLDGFRWDYIEKHGAENLKRIAMQGTRAQFMRPVYPTKTFPNHLSIVTGLLPSNHGVVDNHFCDKAREQCYEMGDGLEDSTWLSGIPLWNLAEMQGVKAATYFWPESDARFNGRTASYYYHYSKYSDYQNRINQMVQWLELPESERPEFIAGYFSLVDSKGHKFGPNAQETKEAVQRVDELIGQFDRRLAELKLDVNLILVSDHGMSQVDPEKAILVKELGVSENDFAILNGATKVHFYKKPTSTVSIDDIKKQLMSESAGRYDVLSKETLLERGIKDDSRLADILIETTAPRTFKYKRPSTEHGMHGYAFTKDMGAIFIAKGPAFKRGFELTEVNNLDVYPTVAKILGLKLLGPIDSDGASIAQAIQ